MSNKRLRVLGFDAGLLQTLNRNGLFTCKDVLSRNELELLQMLNVSVFVVDSILEKVRKACTAPPTTALEMWRARQQKDFVVYLPTAMNKLDAVLRGGVPTGSVTEVAGPAGCGKTQFSLLMCVMATLVDNGSTLGGGAIYIDTESTFSPQRILEIAVNRFSQLFATRESQRDLLSRIHVYSELTCAGLLARFQSLEEIVISRGARIVVLDSLASLVRKEFDAGISHNMAERSKLLAKVAAILKQTSESLSIPIIVTNQITTHIGRSKETVAVNPETPGVGSNHDAGYVTVALGNTWSHCVNTRLIVQYVDDMRRELLIAKSPVAPFTSFVYTIGASGLVLEEDGASFYNGTDPGRQHIRVRSTVANQRLTC